MSQIHWSSESGYAKERRKGKSQHTVFGKPERPYVHQDYPIMLFRAVRQPQGGPPVLEREIAADESAERSLGTRGFTRGPTHAIERLEAQEREYATLAAEREAEKRHLRPQSVAEVEVAEMAAGAQHLPTISETPIKRRGRPRKASAT
jgi:ribosomal protein L20A (L18A)